MFLNINTLRFYFKKKVDYTTHPLFQKSEDFMLLSLDRLRLASTAKEKMVKEFMKLVISSYKDTFLEFIEENPQMVEDLNSEMVEDLMRKSWSKYKKEASLSAIPDLFVHRFDDKYFGYYEFCGKSVRQICVSKLYDTRRDKFLSILDTLDLFLSSIMANVIDTANEFNGELDTLLRGSRFDQM